jgi:hypothetical protein
MRTTGGIVLPCGCDFLAVNGNTPEPLVALVCLHLNTAQLAPLVLDVEIKVLRVMTTRINYSANVAFAYSSQGQVPQLLVRLNERNNARTTIKWPVY